MEFLKVIIWPLTWVFQAAYELVYFIIGVEGLSIIALSLIATLMLLPITRKAQKMEKTEKDRQEHMAPLVAAARAKYKGRTLFEKIDEIYRSHNYHPIKSMASLAPLALQIPFLLAALFFLTEYQPLVGKSFLLISDLSQPDAIIPTPGAYRLNLLPLALTAIALFESYSKPDSTVQSRRRFAIVSIVLLVLIYPFPSAVCLYWLSSNSWSLIRSTIAAR